LQLDEATFGYTPAKIILKNVNIDVQLDSRIAIIGPNGAGKSTLIKLLTGALQPNSGNANHNAKCRIAYFTQHHIDQLDSTMTAVQFLQHKFPGQVEQDYRNHLGAFGITGLTGIQKIGTLSGGQKSRVAFAVLSMSRPHILLLDEVCFEYQIQDDADHCSRVITSISRVSMHSSTQSASSRVV
jgi:ATP-binding cassette subfamily F protein 3